MADDQQQDFSDLKAVIFNGTLTKSPEPSHTDYLIGVSTGILKKQGVDVEIIRTIDHPDIATGVYQDMTEQGWDKDEWPQIYEKVKAANILIIAGPIWLGDNSSMTKKIIERLYAVSGNQNDAGQSELYGRVAGCLITGNEDGVKHCAMDILYSLQHIGYTIPPQADAGWLGEIGPGPSYGDEQDDGSRAGFDSEFTNMNTTFMTWNLLHMARMLADADGIPAYGNSRTAWQDGKRFDFTDPHSPNPEYP